MKTIIKIFIITLTLLFIGCNTETTRRSYELGEAGKFNTTLNFIASKEELRDITIKALTMRKWSLVREGDAIVAKIDYREVSGKLYITFATDTVYINSKGSNINGEAFVPIKLIRNLDKTIKKLLIKKNNSK